MRVGLLTVLAVSICSISASANPITWNLVGVTFDDGGSASGSFVYDANLNQYTSINVTTTDGNLIATTDNVTTSAARPGATYHFFSNGLAPTAGAVLLATSNAADLTGTPGFALFFSSGLTNAGGIVPLLFGQEGSCANAACTGPAPPTRLTTAGAVSAAVPEPASALLIGLGVAMLGAMRFRRRN